MDNPLKEHELLEALNDCKSKSCPGDDGISYEGLKAVFGNDLCYWMLCGIQSTLTPDDF